MASIKELFIKSITEGMKAAEMVSDASQKAQAYAALASALAETGLVRSKEEQAEPTGKEALKPEATKGKAKKKTVKEVETEVAPVEQEEVAHEVVEETTPVEEPVQEEEEVVAEAITPEETQAVETAEVEAIEEASEVELTEEWTDASLEALADEIQFIAYLKEAYDEEQINECIASFSEGLFNTLDDINPLNIKGFVAFMQCLIAQADEE